MRLTFVYSHDHGYHTSIHGYCLCLLILLLFIFPVVQGLQSISSSSSSSLPSSSYDRLELFFPILLHNEAELRFQAACHLASHYYFDAAVPSEDVLRKQSWLQRRVTDMLPTMAADATHCITTQATLCLLLFLQEQRLDQGASVGKRGKYASRYHPTREEYQCLLQGLPTDAGVGREDNRGTRPLTMGELHANWHEQQLLDVLRMRWPVVMTPPPLASTTTVTTTTTGSTNTAASRRRLKRQDPLQVLPQAARDYYERLVLQPEMSSSSSSGRKSSDSVRLLTPTDLLLEDSLRTALIHTPWPVSIVTHSSDLPLARVSLQACLERNQRLQVITPEEAGSIGGSNAMRGNSDTTSSITNSKTNTSTTNNTGKILRIVPGLSSRHLPTTCSHTASNVCIRRAQWTCGESNLSSNILRFDNPMETGTISKEDLWALLQPPGFE